MDIYTVQYDKEFISEIINRYFRKHKEVKIELKDYCFGNELSTENVRRKCIYGGLSINNTKKFSHYKPVVAYNNKCNYNHVTFFVGINGYIFLLYTLNSGRRIYMKQKYHYGKDFNRNLAIELLCDNQNKIQKVCRKVMVILNGL